VLSEALRFGGWVWPTSSSATESTILDNRVPRSPGSLVIRQMTGMLVTAVASAKIIVKPWIATRTEKLGAAPQRSLAPSPFERQHGGDQRDRRDRFALARATIRWTSAPEQKATG